MGKLARRQAELQQRQLALRLRNLELRVALREQSRSLIRPAAWLGAAGSAAGIAVLFAGLRKPGGLLRTVDVVRLGLRIVRLLKSLSA